MAKKKPANRTRDARLMLAFTAAELAPIVAAAKKVGLPVATYIRQLAIVATNS